MPQAQHALVFAQMCDAIRIVTHGARRNGRRYGKRLPLDGNAPQVHSSSRLRKRRIGRRRGSLSVKESTVRGWHTDCSIVR